MKESALGQIRIISIFEYVPDKLELLEFAAITIKTTFNSEDVFTLRKGKEDVFLVTTIYSAVKKPLLQPG
jgi:hypothetical protein